MLPSSCHAVANGLIRWAGTWLGWRWASSLARATSSFSRSPSLIVTFVWTHHTATHRSCAARSTYSAAAGSSVSPRTLASATRKSSILARKFSARSTTQRRRGTAGTRAGRPPA